MDYCPTVAKLRFKCPEKSNLRWIGEVLNHKMYCGKLKATEIVQGVFFEHREIE